MSVVRLLLVTAMAAAPACAASMAPAPLDTVNDACASCRMIVADGRTASQIVSPHEDSRFFDDLGCLQRYLAAGTLPAGSVIYVADYRTGEWVRADDAVFARLERAAGAMGSPIVAFSAEASRVAAEDVTTIVDRSSVLTAVPPAAGDARRSR